jgi:hypothetical protein
MEGPARLGLGGNVFQQSDLPELPELPDPEEVAAALMAITDGAVEALDDLTAERASDGVEGALLALSAALDRLGQQLPSSAVGCEVVAGVLSPRLSADNSSAQCITREEVAAGIQAVAAMLADLRATLLGVTRGEIEDIVEAGLPLARIAVAAARASALRVQQTLSRQRRGSTVIIEDLDAVSSAHCGDGCMAEPTGTGCSINLVPKRRYLWQPIWPRFRQGASSTWKRLAADPHSFLPLHRRQLLILALLPLLGPPVCFCALWVGTWVMLVDAVLQRAYAWKGPVVEDALDTLRQAVRFWSLALRVALRQIKRLIYKQASRLLTKQNLAELQEGCARHLRRVSEDPVGSSKAFAMNAVDKARWIMEKLPQWYAMLPKLSILISSMTVAAS